MHHVKLLVKLLIEPQNPASRTKDSDRPMQVTDASLKVTQIQVQKNHL